MNFSGRATGSKVRAPGAPPTRGNGAASVVLPSLVPRITLATPQKPRQVRFADEATVYAIAPREDPEDDLDDILEEMEEAPARLAIVHSAPDDDVLSISSDDDDDDDSEDEVEVAERVAPSSGILDMVSMPNVTLTVIPRVPVRISFTFTLLTHLTRTQTPARRQHTWHDALNEHAAVAPETIAQTLRLDATDHLPGLAVQPASYRRLVQPTRWLNDEIILAGMSSLLQRYPGRGDAVWPLSSYEIARWREGASVRDLHRHVAPGAPWSRDVLIIPINTENLHWTAAVVYPKHGLIEMFDSLADEARMRGQAQVCAHSFLRTQCTHSS